MTAATATSTQLHLWSGDGPITRTILGVEPRDAKSSEIPIIDVSGLYSTELADRMAVAERIREACTNMGFFYIKNHGVSADTIDAAYKSCLRFFRQPTDIKKKAISPQPDVFNGYHPAATQRINPFESVDVRESFSWKYDPVYDESVADVTKIPAEAAECIVSDDFIWEATQNMPEFKDAIVDYWQSCLKLSRALVRCFALSLGLEETFFDDKFTYPDATFNVNYYPSMEKPAKAADASSQVSIGSHTDFQLFTILWQDHCGGLQVLNKQGQWLNAKPVDGTFVVNIADYLQRITNDLYVSTVHRAQNWSGKERISMPIFFGFNLSESCGVIDKCVQPGETKKYEEVSCREWVNRRSKKMHQT